MKGNTDGRGGDAVRTLTKAVVCPLMVAAIALVATGCGGTIKLTGIKPGSPAAAGQSLFESAGCTSCHMIEGQGGVGGLGPDHRR